MKSKQQLLMLILSIIFTITVNAFGQTKENNIENIVFIDQSLPESSTLGNFVNLPNTEIVFLNPEKYEGIQKVTEEIQKYSGLKSIHLVGHGDDAKIIIGNDNYWSDDIYMIENILKSWKDHFKAEADVYLYGCSIAGSSEGKGFVDLFASFTGLDVVASTNLTGHFSKGGDWVMEYTTGNIESPIAFSSGIETYNYTLQGLNYADLRNYDEVDEGSAGNWTYPDGSGRTAYQSLNTGNPVYLLSKETGVINQVFKGTITVDSNAGDNDDIGFAFGFQSTTNTYIWSWDMGGISMGGTRSGGAHLLYHKTGTSMSFPDVGTLIAQGPNNDPWVHGVTYQFEILYTTDRIRIKVNGVEKFDVSAATAGVSQFPAGRFGFYNYSQGNVTFGNVQSAPASDDPVPPTAQDDSYGMSPNTSLVVDRFEGILKNDYDANLDEFTIVKVSDVSHGSLSLNLEDGSFTYTPTTNYQGGDEFTYKLVQNDTNDESAVRTVSIGVISSNQAPTAIQLSNNEISEGAANNTAIGTLTTTDANNPNDQHDYSLTDNGGGRFTVSGSTLIVANSSLLTAGNYSISVQSSDLFGETTEETFTITVISNDKPTSANSSVTTVAGGNFTFQSSNFSFNDTDGDTFGGIRIETAETAGDLEYDGSDVFDGTVINTISSLVFKTSEGSSGSPYSTFTFKVVDSRGGISASTYTMSINVSSPPVLTTSAASSISYTSAYLGGQVTSEGGSSVSALGVVYSTSNSSPTIGGTGVTQEACTGEMPGSFGETIGSLSSGATYYYQAYATNSQGTSYGGVRSFIVYTPPVLSTGDATIVASSSASISGSLTTVGNPTPTAHGLVWGTSPNPTTGLTTKTNEGSTGSTHGFSKYLEGLEPGTRYYYRSYSTNSLGTIYGEEKSFWTTPMTCYNITASDFVLNNNASLSGDIVTLTPDALGQNGSVWGKMRIDLDYDFKVTSSIYLGTDDGGADGIAFVLQPLSSNAGSSGGGMGYQGISPSYAVEFDTYYNGTSADPTSNDHIAIVKNGLAGSTSAHSPYSSRSNLEDGNWHDAIFEWNATTKYFKVTYEGSVLFNVNIDLTSSVFNNNSNVYWGFTAATGGCKNLQRVDISEYCCSRAASNPPTITAFNDVTICPNTPTSAIGFTIADNESEWGQMSVSATSSNQSVIPESNIVFGGSEGSRTITLSPASNQQGTSDITVTVTDADGQTDSEVFTLTVEDVTPPVLSVVNKTVYLDDAGSASVTEAELVSSATDNCAIGDTTLSTYTFDCDDAGTEVSVTVTLNDANGLNAQRVSQVLVLDTIHPVVVAASDISMGTSYDGMGNCSARRAIPNAYYDDNCTVGLTWEMTGAEEASGSGQIGTYEFYKGITTITYTATDASGNWRQDVMEVEVLDDENPIIAPASDVTANTSDDGVGNCTVQLDISPLVYSDNCPNEVLTWEMTGAVEASGSGQIGTYVFYKGITTITYTVTDESGNISTDVMEVEVLDDEFPIITPSHDQSIGTSHDIDSDCKAAYNVPFLPFTDNCPDAVLAWEMEGATTGSGKGQVGYYSQGFNLGQTHIYYTVTDEAGNESYDDFWLTVTDDEKPRDMGICNSTLDVYLDGNGAVEVDTVAAALNLVKSKVLENCTVGDNLEVNFVTPEYGCEGLLYGGGTYPVQLYVTDEADNILNCQVHINLQDSTRPEVSAINTTLELGENGQASVSATEVDNGSTDNCTIDSIWLSQESFGCGNLGNNTVTFYAKDLSGNIGQQELTVSVEDNILPTVTGQDLSIWLGEDGTRKVSTLEVDAGSYDNCGIDTMWLSQKSFDSSDLGTATLYLYGEDGSGNISVDTVSISVSDTTTPVVQANNISIYLDGTGSATIDTTDINNGSTDNCGIDTMWLSQSSFGCSDVGVNSVTLYAKDASGNTGSEVALVTVSDTANPVMQAKNIDVFLDGNGEVLVQVSDVDNGSSDNCGLESTWLSQDTFSCLELGLNTIYLYGEDAGKNLDSVSAIINVRDTISPVITINEATLYLNAEGELAVSAEGFNGGVWDNCSVDSVWTDLEGFDCDDLGMREVGLYAKDNSGNITRETASIEVLDTVSPMAASHNLDLYLDSNGGATLTAEQVNNGSFDYCGIDTMFIDKDSFSCENLGTGNYVELTVVDNKGNVSTSMATMTVLDTISPIALCQDIEVYLDSVGSGTIGAAQIDNGSSDNCGFELSLSKRVFGAEELGDNLITMTVSDASGNQSTCESTVTVLDTIAPVVVCNETTFVLWENGEYVVDGTDKQTLLAGTWDNSAGILPMDSISLGAVSFECVDVLNGGSTITVTASDGQGNIATAVCPVEVVDLIAPTANCIDTVMVTLDGTGSKIVSASDINDGSDTESTPAWARTYNDLEGGSYDACGIAAMEVSQNLFGCADIGFKTVTLTVSDPHGNTGSCESVVHVVDAVAPEFEPVSDIVVELEPGVCTAEVEYPEVIAVDQCGGLSYTLLEGQGPDGVFPIGGGVEKWLVTDKSGNTDTLSFSVLVSTYNAAPVIDPLGTVHIDKDTAQISVALTGIGAGIDCGGQMATIVSARAADTLLLTSTEVVYAPGDSEGELILGIAPGMSGSTMVTVRVQDNGGTDNGGVDTFEESFLVVVDPYNKAPYLVSEIIDYEVVADHELEVGISCRCGDLFDDRDDETLSIKVTLADGSELPSWGHYANDVLTITPTRRDTGCVEILVTATDSDGLSATTSFNVCILNWVTGVATFEAPLDVKMYPNPAKGMVNLDVTGANTELEVVVMDISGKEVLRKEFMQNNQIRFDMGGQVSGMYFVRVNVDGREIVKKLILDRR